MKVKYIIIVAFCFVSYVCSSQTDLAFKKTRDSLMALPTDSVKVNALIAFFLEKEETNFIECMQLSETILDMAASINLPKRKAYFLNKIGDVNFNRAYYKESFKYYYRAYQYSDSIKSPFHLALSAYNLGWQAAIQQKNYKDVSFIYQALKIGKEINSSGILLRTHNALGSFYTDKFEREHKRSDFDSAVTYFNMAIEQSKSLKRFTQAGALYINLGQLFYHSKDYTSSVFYYEKAKDLFKEDSNNVVSCLHKIAMCQYAMNNKDAYKTYEFVYAYTKKNDMKELMKEALYSLKDHYYSVKQFQKAYDCQKEYYAVLQETNGEFNALSIKNLETNYNYIKSEAANVQLKQASEIQELKNKRKSFYITVLAGIALIILVITYLLFKQNKIRQLTNDKLKEQNKIISEKKLEIEQSIEYAKGIQTAFLPSKDELNLLIKENFIYYKPKDVVSGDFYWYLINEEQNGLLLACADCTGHGVPGALMSMVGINILQQLSVERKMHSPGLILKYLNAEIKNSLKQNSDQSTQRDGMDVAMIHLDLTSRKLTYAGANRPLYIVRNGEVIEHKATKHAIGGFTKYDQTFDEVKIELKKDDLICLSTDGFADQFGGPEAKKFMTKNLKALLVKIAHLSAAEQMAELETVFNNWKGRHGQIDDVCVIGIKV